MIRRLLIVVACVATWCAAAHGGSGDYSVEVRIGDHTPNGEHVVTGDLGGSTLSGSLDVSIDVEGRATATLLARSTQATLVGTYKRRGDFEKLTLRGIGSQPKLKVKLTRLGGASFHGKIKGGGGALGGLGRVVVSGSELEPLQTSLLAGTRNGVSSLRLGAGWATVGSATIPVASKVKLGRSLDRLKFSGAGYTFSAKGVIRDASVSISTFRLKTHGIVVRGSGSMGFAPNGPEVALILSSGHPETVFASDARPYLSDDVGPVISQRLTTMGLQHTIDSFVDHSDGTVHGPGFDDLVATLQLIRDVGFTERIYPTRVVVIDHSHGGARAHTAIWLVPELPITALVDLDASSCLFKSGHLFESVIDPVSAFEIGGVFYDMEDVVFPNVKYNLDVRSGDVCVNLVEFFDDARNVRTDRTVDGLWLYEPENSSHGEVHNASGVTVQVVANWLEDRLRE